jgi:hypothetical protein
MEIDPLALDSNALNIFQIGSGVSMWLEGKRIVPYFYAVAPTC